MSIETRDDVRAIRKRLNALYRAARTLGRILASERLREAASTISDAIDALEVLDERFREDALVCQILDLAGFYERRDDAGAKLCSEVSQGSSRVILNSARRNAPPVVAYGGGAAALEIVRDELKRRIVLDIETCRDDARHAEQAWSLWAERRLEQIEALHHRETSP